MAHRKPLLPRWKVDVADKELPRDSGNRRQQGDRGQQGDLRARQGARRVERGALDEADCDVNHVLGKPNTFLAQAEIEGVARERAAARRSGRAAVACGTTTASAGSSPVFSDACDGGGSALAARSARWYCARRDARALVLRALPNTRMRLFVLKGLFIACHIFASQCVHLRQL